MIKTPRDERGRFTYPPPDPELVKKWARDEGRAKIAAKVCEQFKLPMDYLGILQLSSGVWSFGRESQAALLSLLSGVIIGQTLKSNVETAEAIDRILRAAGMKETFIKALAKKRDKAQPAA
jgi:hypothetical protein